MAYARHNFRRLGGVTKQYVMRVPLATAHAYSPSS